MRDNDGLISVEVVEATDLSDHEHDTDQEQRTEKPPDCERHGYSGSVQSVGPMVQRSSSVGRGKFIKAFTIALPRLVSS